MRLPKSAKTQSDWRQLISKGGEKKKKKLWRECHSNVVSDPALQLFLLHVNSSVISKQTTSCE